MTEDDELLSEEEVLGDNCLQTVLFAEKGDTLEELGKQLKQQIDAVDVTDIRLAWQLWAS